MTCVAPFVLLANISDEHGRALYLNFESGDQRIFCVNNNVFRFPLNLREAFIKIQETIEAIERAVFAGQRSEPFSPFGFGSCKEQPDDASKTPRSARDKSEQRCRGVSDENQSPYQQCHEENHQSYPQLLGTDHCGAETTADWLVMKMLEIKTKAIDREPKAHKGHGSVQISEVSSLIREMLRAMCKPRVLRYCAVRFNGVRSVAWCSLSKKCLGGSRPFRGSSCLFGGRAEKSRHGIVAKLEPSPCLVARQLGSLYESHVLPAVSCQPTPSGRSIPIVWFDCMSGVPPLALPKIRSVVGRNTSPTSAAPAA